MCSSIHRARFAYNVVPPLLSVCAFLSTARTPNGVLRQNVSQRTWIQVLSFSPSPPPCENHSQGLGKRQGTLMQILNSLFHRSFACPPPKLPPFTLTHPQLAIPAPHSFRSSTSPTLLQQIVRAVTLAPQQITRAVTLSRPTLRIISPRGRDRPLLNNLDSNRAQT
jgi:hypothetical protein